MSWQEALRGRADEVKTKKLTVGFDGFVDTIYRPVKEAAGAGAAARPFGTIREFGEYLITKAEKSCSIQMITQARRLGGNMPNLSNAAGTLGLHVNCIGMLGDVKKPDRIFSPMPCRLYSFMQPGQSTCLEFSDGKVFLAPEFPADENLWQSVLEATDGQASDLFWQSDLMALVNWAELPFSYGLWKKVLTTAPDGAEDRSRHAFFDLCDVSSRSAGELEQVLELVGAFSGKRTTILSLNENEALVAADKLLPGVTELLEIAGRLRSRFGIDEIIIHTIRETLLATSRGVSRQVTSFVEHPRISTGAGDNFNGGFCFATIMGLADGDRVAFANTYAHTYIVKGSSPSLYELYSGADRGEPG